MWRDNTGTFGPEARLYAGRAGAWERVRGGPRQWPMVAGDAGTGAGGLGAKVLMDRMG